MTEIPFPRTSRPARRSRGRWTGLADRVASLPKARQRDHGEAMLDLVGEVTGVDPVMWGPSIVGYGELTHNGLAESPDARRLLDRLGRHKRSVACVHIPRLEDVRRSPATTGRSPTGLR